MKIIKKQIKELVKYHAINNRPHLSKQWEKSLEGLNQETPVFYWFNNSVYHGAYAIDKAKIEVLKAWKAKALDQESKQKKINACRLPTFFSYS